MLALSRKDAWFLLKTLALSILLPVAVIGVGAYCIDWRGPVDDLPATERARMEDCAFAQRELGDRILRDRPDCRSYVEPRPMAAVIPTDR